MADQGVLRTTDHTSKPDLGRPRINHTNAKAIILSHHPYLHLYIYRCHCFRLPSAREDLKEDNFMQLQNMMTKNELQCSSKTWLARRRLQ